MYFVPNKLVTATACQMRARSRYFHWRWPDDAYPSHPDMFEVFCCPSTTTKHAPICVKRRDVVAHRGAGVFQAWLRLRNSCRPSEATHGQVLVCAERQVATNFTVQLSHLSSTFRQFSANIVAN